MTALYRYEYNDPRHVARATGQLLPGSVYVDANDISHRPTATALSGDDQAQRPGRKDRAIHSVCNLNRPACELRGDLGEGDDSDVSVRAGDTDSKVHLIGRLRGIDHAGINKNVPKKRASPLVLLLTTTRHEADALSEGRQLGDTLGRSRSRGRPGALYENSPRGRRRLDQRHRVKAVRLQNRLTGLRQDERSEAIGHWLRVKHDHAVGRPHGELAREWDDSQARHLADDHGGAAAVAERHVCSVGQEDPLNGALAREERRSLVTATV